ncbi:uncharacterized protein LOC113472603 [Diaphorina citri]|uniref:Uncharacterized protein LOC113472603 n=1 Tax=Diaphorina citri TaxID=121845 RepID=A0A3Q0JM19_DIACI|nr:uncharacterized protein LOC113472603 [Diaphorina citri]
MLAVNMKSWYLRVWISMLMLPLLNAQWYVDWLRPWSHFPLMSPNRFQIEKFRSKRIESTWAEFVVSWIPCIYWYLLYWFLFHQNVLFRQRQKRHVIGRVSVLQISWRDILELLEGFLNYFLLSVQFWDLQVFNHVDFSYFFEFVTTSWSEKWWSVHVESERSVLRVESIGVWHSV